MNEIIIRIIQKVTSFVITKCLPSLVDAMTGTRDARNTGKWIGRTAPLYFNSMNPFIHIENDAESAFYTNTLNYL
jgi:hypothetical protein